MKGDVLRIGIGYDVHALTPDRKLVIGGVTIPFYKGLQGYSDADVLIHAICDALLGACSLGDMGEHFPENDPRIKNIYSIRMLEEVYQMVVREGFTVSNIDAIIFAQAPKMLPYKSTMSELIADTLSIGPNQVNIKAKTNNGLGMIGSGECIAAECIVLLEKS